jgi:hypothetical protein
MAIAEVVWLVRRGSWSPWALYALTSGVSMLGVAKWGAGESYFLGVIAATSVLAAAWIARFLGSAPAPSLRLVLGGALLIQAVLLSHAGLSAVLPWLPDRGLQGAQLGRTPTVEDVEAGELITARVRRVSGPALSEDPSFAVAAGRPLIGNATHLRNLYQAGLWDPRPMVDDVRAHKYAIVILDAELYPEPVLTAIGQFYFQDQTVHMHGATYHVFLPGK